VTRHKEYYKGEGGGFPTKSNPKNCKISDLLSLPRLLTNKRHGKELLVDYFSSHVVTLEKHLTILRQKALEKKLLIKSRSKKKI